MNDEKNKKKLDPYHFYAGEAYGKQMIAGRLKGKIMDKLGVRVEEYITKLRGDVDGLSNQIQEKTGGDSIGKTARQKQ